MSERERARSLREVLTEAAAWIHTPPEQVPGRTRADRAPAELSPGQRRELEQLVGDALRSGMVENALARSPLPEPYSEGATALLVCSISVDLEFVVKWQADAKILREAAYLQSIAARSDLPARVRDRLPRVYAVYRGDDRHAYLMQKFPSPPYAPLATRLAEQRDDETVCQRAISAAWDALFETYAATLSGPEQPLLPNLRSIYVDRIASRLGGRGGPDELRRLVERPLLLRTSPSGDAALPPCAEMLEELQQLWPRLAAALTPSFVTLVLGDPHPGNILIDLDYAGVRDVKFIDPKEWGQGDYLFDVAKFLHYVEVTWLVEDLHPPDVALSEEGDGVRLAYELEPPAWLGYARKDASRRIREFLSHNRLEDPLWELRLELGMASNLLGVAGSRYRDPEASPNARRVVFAEGARALHRFLEGARTLARAGGPAA